MNERSRVEVIWHDAHSIGQGEWCSSSDISEEPCVVTTIGWLLPGAKEDHVVIAQSITNEGDLDSVLCVPVGMVKSMKILC